MFKTYFDKHFNIPKEEREKFIQEVETNFTEEEQIANLWNTGWDFREIFVFDYIDSFVKKDIEERIKKHPTNNVILFEKYVVFKLYEHIENLTNATKELYAKCHNTREC